MSLHTQMLPFILKNLPEEWDKDTNYNDSYKLFTLDDYSDEYRRIKQLFDQKNVKSVIRVQNPFQYGRFKLRQEMCDTYSVETVFHIVHEKDLNIALKYTCDYRRYKSTTSSKSDLQPKFYDSINTAIGYNFNIPSNTKLLIIYKMSGDTLTQSDYYIQYIVSLE